MSARLAPYQLETLCLSGGEEWNYSRQMSSWGFVVGLEPLCAIWVKFDPFWNLTAIKIEERTDIFHTDIWWRFLRWTRGVEQKWHFPFTLKREFRIINPFLHASMAIHTFKKKNPSVQTTDVPIWNYSLVHNGGGSEHIWVLSPKSRKQPWYILQAQAARLARM